MRFSLQSGTQAGLQQASPALCQMSSALLEADDWAALDRETQAVGLTLGLEEETRPWMEALASREPVRALDLALRAAKYSLSFARAGEVIARVLRVTGPTTTASLPSAEFWRELRRSIQDSDVLRAEVAAVAARFAPSDLRLRAGLAYVLPEDERWWTKADRAAALRVGDRETGALMLLGLVRQDALTLRSLVWPPPLYALRGLDDAVAKAAHLWHRTDDLHAPPGPASAQAITAAFQHLAGVNALIMLASLAPTPLLVRRARKLPRGATATQRLIRSVLADAWELELTSPGALPPLTLLDGTVLTKAFELSGLRGALRARDQARVDAFARRATPESLGAFAAALFVRWMLEGSPRDGEWALEAVARFPSDAAADTLGELALEEVRAAGNLRLLFPSRQFQRVTRVLAAMGTRRALTSLSAVVHSEELVLCRTETALLFEKAAQAQGLSGFELEDRLFPALCLPASATVRLEEGAQMVLEREGRPMPLPADWEAAAEVLPLALRRLERRMCDGPPMSALLFTEVWGLNPLLMEVARSLVWGVFRGEKRIGLLMPGAPGRLQVDDTVGVRPLHPVELTEVERFEARSWLTDEPQPFPQLDRPCFPSRWPALPRLVLDDFQRLDHLLARFGWERPPAGQGPLWVRAGETWQARLAFTDEEMDVLFETRLRLSEFSLSGSAPWRVVSELQRELAIVSRQEQPGADTDDAELPP